MYLNPNKMSAADQNRIAAWLERNGCRHYIAMDPIVIRGNVAEYTALCRKDAKSCARMRLNVARDELVPLGRRRLRIRKH